MKDILPGWKTKITGIIIALIPLLGLIGVELDREAVVSWVDGVFEWILVGYTLAGAAVVWFRNLANKRNSSGGSGIFSLLLASSLLFGGGGYAVEAHAAPVALCDEISNDPLARGYSTMSAIEQAADLNNEYRTRWLECVEGSKLLDAIAAADWNAITDTERQLTLSLLSVGCLDPQENARTLLIRIFGSGSDTIANMATISQESISRATELGLPFITPGLIGECI